ncbi:MAG: alpha/beta hydrolase [Phycisphaerales bacterium]|jgi:pimeloyl-ACP methyl ester carboxylesterase
MTPTPTSLDFSSHALSQTPRAFALRGLADKAVQADVIDTGTGNPVVFLHGLVGLNDHWETVAQRVALRNRCIMLQLPLLGLTGDDCSIHGATELTARFLQQYVGGPCVIVGNSFGGHVALRLAVEQPQLLRGLVLAGSSGLIEKSMVSDVQIRPSREWLERKIGELFYDKSKMNPNDVERAFRELSERGHARAMVKLSRSARRNHLGSLIGSIKAPTLLIWGREDIVTPPEAAMELNAKIRSSRLCWLDRCGHAPMIERPDEFADALIEFLGELDRTG